MNFQKLFRPALLVAVIGATALVLLNVLGALNGLDTPGK
jgi:hypothetical protein